MPNASILPLGHPEMPPAPVTRADLMLKRRGKGRWRPQKRACFSNAAPPSNGGCDMTVVAHRFLLPKLCEV